MSDPLHHAAAITAGAECLSCPLYMCGAGPVPPTLPPDGYEIPFLVVAEAPGRTEVEEGRTLIGASGKEVRTALQSAGISPAAVSYTNAILCQPPDTLDNYQRQVKRAGQRNPIECCRPRLQAEIRRSRFVMLMGGASLEAVGINSSITKLRGTPVQIPNGPPAVPILHAAFVMRESGRVMRPVFHFDVKKAVRLAIQGTTWVPPRYFVPQNAAQISNFLSQPQAHWAVDLETDGIDPWTCRIRRVGIGTSAEVMIYAPLSVRGHALLDPLNQQAQTRAINDFYTRAERLTFHNYYGFDSIVSAQHGFKLDDAKVWDTLVAHRVGPTSELPHRLDFLGSVYTDAPYWKDDVKHSNVKDDGLLDRYLSYDIAVTHIAGPMTAQTLAQSDQTKIYNVDTVMSQIGRSMSGLGIRVDMQRRYEFAVEYQAKSDRLKREFQDAAGSEVNPGSYPQLKKLLYDTLGLPILDEHRTATGEASTDEPTLLELLGMGLDKRAQTVIRALLGYRAAENVLSNNTGHVENGVLVGGPPIHVDGRLRTGWNPGKTTGRWGSSDPVNMQNIPHKLRAMFVPADGNVFVCADYSALELRIIALLAEDEPLIQAFAAFDAGTGPDLHIFNACQVFGCTPEDVTKEVRDFIKRFVYALSYDAQPPTIYQTLSLLRDDDLNPKFPQITLAEVQRVFGIWWKLHPAIPTWKKKLIQQWRRTGYIATPWHDRRRYFLGGEKKEEMGNLPVQGGGADLQNTAVNAFCTAYPFDFAAKTGLIIQGHDALVAETKAEDAVRVAGIMEWAMQKKIGPMLFPAKAKVGSDWKAVS